VSGFQPNQRQGPWWLDLTFWVDRAYRAFCAVRDEVALSRLSPAAWRRITTERYGRHAGLYDHPESSDRELHGWERAAIDDCFPPPPARLLVGGAGAGREVLALAARGYCVAGFEPSIPLYDVLCRRVKDAGVEALALGRGGYEELLEVMRMPEGQRSLEGELGAIVSAAPYDGVILGWGSVSCVPAVDTREGLLPAVARLCPRGPVLLSFTAAAPRLGRTARLSSVARQLLRGLPSSHPVAPGDELDHFGFLHAYTDDEIETLAKRAGYRVGRLSHHFYAHAVLVPEAPLSERGQPMGGPAPVPPATRAAGRSGQGV
jgi:hypothetical protein